MTGKPDPSAIFEILRDRICLLDYPPGAILRERELAAEFGVSRTPVRAALQQLAHGGLVQSRDGVGTIITEPTPAEIRDIYEMRMKIATLIGDMSPKPLSHDMAGAAAGLMESARDLMHHFDLGTYWQINHRLHFLISGIIGNMALRQIWDDLYFRSARFWYQYARNAPEDVAEALLREIEDVALAIRENDPVALGYGQRNAISLGLRKLAI